MSLLQSIRDGDLFQRRRAAERRTGLWNVLLASAYIFGETAYFGWNLIPRSGVELACDGIGLALLMISTNAYARTSKEDAK